MGDDVEFWGGKVSLLMRVNSNNIFCRRQTLKMWQKNYIVGQS
jgi:hypothetical protein